MSRIDDPIAELYPDDVEFQALGDIAEPERGSGISSGPPETSNGSS